MSTKLKIILIIIIEIAVVYTTFYQFQCTGSDLYEIPSINAIIEPPLLCNKQYFNFHNTGKTAINFYTTREDGELDNAENINTVQIIEPGEKIDFKIDRAAKGKTLFHINKVPNDSEDIENNEAHYTYQFT